MVVLVWGGWGASGVIGEGRSNVSMTPRRRRALSPGPCSAGQIGPWPFLRNNPFAPLLYYISRSAAPPHLPFGVVAAFARTRAAGPFGVVAALARTRAAEL